jgi:hypothetical protein
MLPFCSRGEHNSHSKLTTALVHEAILLVRSGQHKWRDYGSMQHIQKYH